MRETYHENNSNLHFTIPHQGLYGLSGEVKKKKPTVISSTNKEIKVDRIIEIREEYT
jgi:hypothetical protein